MNQRRTVAIVGAGSLASCLAPALSHAGYTILEIVTRAPARVRSKSAARARALAASVGARAATVETAAFDADLLWLCVPDREIRSVASAIAKRKKASSAKSLRSRTRFAFHSSGALLSSELEPLARSGFLVASVHPLMTFVPGARPSLSNVPFALEGDAAATKLAKELVRDLGGKSLLLSPQRKAAYHAWATMTSPLLVAYLITLEDAAREAGLKREDARLMSLPIIAQTLANYRTLGPESSFSGPFVRGDASTIARHLKLLKKRPAVRAVYVELARAALLWLPAKNRPALHKALSHQDKHPRSNRQPSTR
jgi:predicted short-subunit dehydrogenase-like oxidoreductase (DUF2520 family)